MANIWIMDCRIRPGDLSGELSQAKLEWFWLFKPDHAWVILQWVITLELNENQLQGHLNILLRLIKIQNHEHNST